MVVQTMQRTLGPGGRLQPLVVTPAIGLRVSPDSRILPLDGAPMPVRVTVHAQAAAEGAVSLDLPSGWTSTPPAADFRLKAAGDSEPIEFQVTPPHAMPADGVLALKAVASSAGKEYRSGWQSLGWPGLRPYNLYQPAEIKTRAVDLHLAPGIRLAYVMGTGDTIPDALEGLGIKPHLLTASELSNGDLSAWNVILVGIRAYSARPDLTAAQPRLDAWVRAGGALVVQYQSGHFPSTLPLSLGRAERVVDESAPVSILAPADPLLTTPNRITAADFDGWVEERGHSVLTSWDPAFTALTRTADPGQDPQDGGLIVAHPGKGTYIYCAYALHRQLPELVPGAWRLLANLLSAGR